LNCFSENNNTLEAAESDKEVLVSVSNLGKKFAKDLKRSLFYGLADMASELTGQQVSAALRKSEFWALRNVNFELRRGESLSIIGPNGSGKSTLLKLITGIIKPTEGEVTIYGRVQALIELGSGMNPILTGRENIYINAAILGIPHEKIKDRFQSIVEYSELGEFIDMPVKNYSSGMRVRLGFAVAINVEPDILIVDEVLAVGDQAFRIKARETISELLDRDIAVIFVSHNINEVLNITQKSIRLESGGVYDQGEAEKVCGRYFLDSISLNSHIKDDVFERDNVDGELVWLKKAERLGKDFKLDANSKSVDSTKEKMSFTFGFKGKFKGKVNLTFVLRSQSAQAVGYTNFFDIIDTTEALEHERVFVLDTSLLLPGQYSISVQIRDVNNAFIHRSIGVLRFAKDQIPSFEQSEECIPRVSLGTRIKNTHGHTYLNMWAE
jgi:ABC-type polysaccharide/polyol phosphate transport system ATPase subunit